MSVAELTTNIRNSAMIRKPVFPSKTALFRSLAESKTQDLARGLSDFLDFAVSQNFLTSEPFLVSAPPTTIGAEVAKLKYDEILTEMRSRKEVEAITIAARFHDALKHGRERNLFGRLEWLAADVCRFSYFKGMTVGFSETENGKTVRYEEHLHIRYEHDVIDASLRSPRAVWERIPKEVQRIVEKAPEPLARSLGVVVGTEILAKQEVINSVRVRQELPRQTFKADPALVIGDFVIAGWVE